MGCADRVRALARGVAKQISRESAQVMADVRRVVTAKGRAGVGAFLVEGRRMLERALRAGWAPRQLLVGEAVAEEQAEVQSLLAQVTALGCAWHRVPDVALLELAQGRSSGLLTALFSLPSGLPLPEL